MKKLIMIIPALILVIIFSASVSAEESSYPDLMKEINGRISASAGDDANSALKKNNITVDKPSSISEIKVSNVFSWIYNEFIDTLKKPLKILGKICAVALICAAVKALSPDNSSVSEVVDIVVLLTVAVIMSDSLSSSIVGIKKSIEDINTFLISYVPVFSGITAAGGGVSAGSSYYAVLLTVCELTALIASKIMIPFISIIMAITLVSSINPNLRFSGVAESVKKCVTWILGLAMTVFSGLVTIQSFAGSAADTAVIRTAKFAASSFIPVIGGSVSEAYSAVRSGVGVIRNCTGVIGIIVVIVIVAKPLLSIIAVKLVIWLGKIINDLFGVKNAAEMLKNINAVMSVAMSIVICYALIFITATAVVMMTAVNSGV